MPASWGELFDRGAAYDVDLERVRTTADELSEADADGEPGASSGTTERAAGEEGDDA